MRFAIGFHRAFYTKDRSLFSEILLFDHLSFFTSFYFLIVAVLLRVIEFVLNGPRDRNVGESSKKGMSPSTRRHKEVKIEGIDLQYLERAQ